MLVNRSKAFFLLSNQLRGAVRSFSAKAQPETNKPKEKWDLYASVLLERHPVITKELSSLEKKMQVRSSLFQNGPASKSKSFVGYA